MKRLIFPVLIVFACFSGFSQGKTASKEDVKTFMSSKTYFVNEEDPFSAFNEYIRTKLTDVWKITPFEIITPDQFEKKSKDEKSSFVFISQARFSKTKTSLFSAGTTVFDNLDTYDYTIINLVLGNKTGNINLMPDLCIVPVAYSEVEDKKYDYKFGALLAFMQYYIKYSIDNPGKDIENLVKENAPKLKSYELWFVKEDLAADVNTLEKIKKLYPYPVKFVTADDIKLAIEQRNPKIAFLHKVGPEGTTTGDSRCWKFIITAKDGMPLYFDSHKISDKKPDKFLDDDFKGMAK